MDIPMKGQNCFMLERLDIVVPVPFEFSPDGESPRSPFVPVDCPVKFVVQETFVQRFDVDSMGSSKRRIHALGNVMAETFSLPCNGSTLFEITVQ
jgi:hypothetical protein